MKAKNYIIVRLTGVLEAELSFFFFRAESLLNKMSDMD